MKREEGTESRRSKPYREGFTSVVGVLVAGCGAAMWNPWTVDWLLGSGDVEDHRTQRVILGIGLILVVCGLAIARRRTQSAGRVGLLLFACFALFPILAEVLLRVAIGAGSDRLRDPQRYADFLSDDDYWKLQFRWNPETPITDRVSADPMLGWLLHPTESNPLGAYREIPYRVHPDRPVVLFVGDSFVQGTDQVPMSERLPQRLDRLLEERDVYNLGVGGYGVDQIYLRMVRAFEDLDKMAKGLPTAVVFAIYTHDLDRSILTVRSGPKPRFRVDGQNLVLTGTPVDTDPRGWFEHHPPSIRGYAASFAVQWSRLRLGGDEGWTESLYRRREKQVVNRKIIEATIAEAHRRDVPILFVIIESKGVLTNPGWRRRFLSRVFSDNEIPWIDSACVLNRAAGDAGIDPDAAYYGADSHFNAAGNGVVAREIAGEFERGFAPFE